MTFAVSYDSDARAAYIRVSGKAVARTEEIIEDRAWMDLDAGGEITGIEVVAIEAADLHHVMAALEEATVTIHDRLGDRPNLLALR